MYGAKTQNMRPNSSTRDRAALAESAFVALAVSAALLTALACRETVDTEPESLTAQASESPTAAASEPAAPSEGAPRIVFLGDSLTAGLGLDESQAFPAVIGRRLEARGITAQIVNAGVSGDTTAGGVTRIEWVLRQEPDILVVGLGGNDGLRGLSPEMTEDNLRRILSKALVAGSRPVLLGMRLPPNLGPQYVQRFEEIYPRLAAELDVTLVPFMLDGVAGVTELNLPDGIHPTAEGQVRVAENLLPWILEALESLWSVE